MKKNIPRILSVAILALILTPTFSFALIGTAPASGGNPPTSGGNPPTSGGNPSSPPTEVNIRFENPFKFGDSLYDVLKSIVDNVVLPIGGILCVLAFIYAGFMYVTAGGDTTKIGKAHNALLYAAIGTAVLLGAWVIAGVIKTTVEALAK